jgi:hypothetical protein
MQTLDPAWLALFSTVIAGAVFAGKALGVLDRLAKAVDNLAAAHTTTETTVAGHAVRLDSHEKRLDDHDDQLREMR